MEIYWPYYSRSALYSNIQLRQCLLDRQRKRKMGILGLIIRNSLRRSSTRRTSTRESSKTWQCISLQGLSTQMFIFPHTSPWASGKLTLMAWINLPECLLLRELQLLVSHSFPPAYIKTLLGSLSLYWQTTLRISTLKTLLGLLLMLSASHSDVFK